MPNGDSYASLCAQKNFLLGPTAARRNEFSLSHCFLEAGTRQVNVVFVANASLL